MRDDLRPLSLTEAARSLGIDPFEVVRLMVAGTGVPQGQLYLTREQVETLRSQGGIDPSWWEGARLPDDPNPRRRRLRAALSLLLVRDHVGDSVTRLDNVTRGLPPEEQRFLTNALRILSDVGLLTFEVRLIGVMVAVVPSAVGQVRTIADGNDMPAALTGLLGG